MELQELICKCCTAPLDPAKATGRVIRCVHCGTAFIMAKSNQSKVQNFLNQGEHELDSCDFDKAYTAYAKAAELDSEEPEAYFGMALSTFKVQYLKDEANDPPRLQPICHEVTDKKFTENANYRRALALATAEQRKEYEKRGEEIDYILGEFFKLKQSGLDYDCFLCVKVTGEDGRRTEDCDRANDIYYYLRDNGLKPFFSEREMKGKSGSDYEAMILYALYMSECMIVVCSDESYLKTKWVKNEYTRFGAMMADENKEYDAITIAFTGKPIERLPGKSGKLQGIDIGKPDGFARVEEFVKRHTVAARAAREAEAKRRQEQQAQILAQIEAQKAAQKELEEKLRSLENEKAESYDYPSSGTVTRRRRKKFRWTKKKILALVLSGVFVFLGVGALTGGLIYKSAMDKVGEVEELIAYLPDYTIKDYSQYENLFDAALEGYEGLSDFQKGKVGNKDRLLNALEGFNTYRVEKLRGYVAEIDPETVEESGNLKNAVEIYAKFTEDQRALLSSEERYALEQYKKVQEVIDALIAIHGDVLARYDEVEDVKRIYLTIDPDYQNLVYNYGLIDTFAELVEFHRSLSYKQVNGGYSVSLAEGKTLSGAVELPARYKGQNVVEIPEGAFKDCRGITSLVVPDTVQTIGKGAFEGCNNLVDITLPFVGDSATKAASDYEGRQKVFGWIFNFTVRWSDGDERTSYPSSSNKFTNKFINVANEVNQYTFSESYGSGYYYCYYIPTTLRNVTITKQVDIPTAAFNNCTMLESVQYDSVLNNLNKCAFQNCSSLIKFNSETEGTVDLKGNVETIGDYAFAGCLSLTTIEIPESIHVFGTSAFDGDRAITELTLTDRVTQIGDYAFRGLSLITEVTVYNSTVSIGQGAFEGCNNLVDITLPFTGNSAAKAASDYEGRQKVFGWIFDFTVRWSDGEERTSYPSSSNKFVNKSINAVNEINQYTFSESYGSGYYYCYNIPTTLRHVTITKQVDIPLAAFNNCTMLEKVTYTNKIMSQGECAFQNCVSPTEESANSIAFLNFSYILPKTSCKKFCAMV